MLTRSPHLTSVYGMETYTRYEIWSERLVFGKLDWACTGYVDSVTKADAETIAARNFHDDRAPTRLRIVEAVTTRTVAAELEV